MNFRTRLSRSNGYRELGMFDESILILEDIPFDENAGHPLVVAARYNSYRDSEGMDTCYDHGKTSSIRVNLTVLSGY